MDQGYPTQSDRPARSNLPQDGKSAPSPGIVSRVRSCSKGLWKYSPNNGSRESKPTAADTPLALDVGWVAHARRSFAATGRIRRGRPLFPRESVRIRYPAAGTG